ncbi:TGACG-sequence-specific DNA-binding protein TGA-2.1 [Hibiscus syriacus]|uniref:TGACG-sequence-specific DNA-binding protein TGA-2.1 n=1 Tax=Hibiscus syriacus TaxID=106335 RepID=A0A6A3ACK0_HIBSY|nr:TGACG-sequence-specific DNA-binding protein TGA-2.1 [Hibiscus syriacus]
MVVELNFGDVVLMGSSGDNYMNQSILRQQQQQNNQYHLNQVPYAMMQSSSSSSIPHNFISKDSGSYDLGELDQSLFLYLDGQDPSTIQHQTNNPGMKPPTLNIFPSQPMHTNTGLVSPATSSCSKRPSESSMELANARNDGSVKAVKREGNRKGPTSSSEQEGPNTPDTKTLRRLAQNREAARKSRLRKKTYVQQLESSRIKLTQLEQELQRARAQGVFFGGGNILALGGDQSLPVGINNISPDAAMFDMEYASWREEHHRVMCELRAAVHQHVPENELGILVHNCLAHLDHMMNLKTMLAKTDVFHLVSGTWMTPAERCFMWMGGFRPSQLIRVILNEIEALTEQQIIGICGLQQSTQEAEEALTQGLEAMNQSLSDIITSDSLSCPPNMTNYMGQMAMAINKLSTLEGFVRQVFTSTILLSCACGPPAP